MMRNKMKGKRPIRKREDKEVKIKEEKKEVLPPIPIKLFNKWDTNAEVKDPGLKKYINLYPRLLPRSAGTKRERFHKSKMHIVERLALHFLISGHRGKNHRLSSGRFGGSLDTVLKHVEKSLDIIEKKEKKNPIQILVTAIENAAAREEIVSFQLGSIVAREAVVTSPQRRIDKTLRYIAQGSYRKSFRSKRSLAASLAEELINASKGSNQSSAIQEKERIEREATGAR
ncbi:30S ribosomal protein S7 [Candidatus Aenigmatarchaeota archaeon]